jgi:hypothetical protein
MELDKIAPALVALQADMETVGKTAENPFFHSKYTPLPQVMEALQPLLKKHKLAILLPLTNIDGVNAIKTVVLHESGQIMEFDPFPLILAKQDPQGQGSAVTYARRYALQSVTGMVSDEDDDGNKAQKPYWKKAKESEENIIDMANFDDGTEETPATDEQILEIKSLSKTLGLSDNMVKARLVLIKTDQQAIVAIKKLHDKLNES